MQIRNFFQINDWEIKKFLRLIFIFQLTIFAVIALESVGFQIPIIRPIIGFVYLTFIPGIVLLRVFKIHNTGNIKTIIYATGLSIACVMFSGLFVNIIYPLFGISQPISLIPLLITISIFILLFSILCYFRDKDYSHQRNIDLKINVIITPKELFLFLLPFLAIFGTYLMNMYNINILLIFLLFFISLIPVLVSFNKLIQTKLYPMVIFLISISLLFHRSLISLYLTGYDIQKEYFLANIVKTNSIWSLGGPSQSSMNSLLSLSILSPIYSIFLNIDIIWVFKIIYPLLFSLVPLGLYLIFQKQTNEKIAFFSVFLFMSIFSFYSELLELTRMQIGEIFLILLILLIMDKTLEKINRSLLLIIFGFSLTVSYYAITYIFLFSIILIWIISFLIRVKTENSRNINSFSSNKNNKEKFDKNLKKDNAIDTPFVLLFIVFTMAWYIYISFQSATFSSLVFMITNTMKNILTEILNPISSQGLSIITSTPTSILNNILRYLHLIVQLFIILGIFTYMIKQKNMKFDREYGFFSLIMFVLAISGILLPYSTIALNSSRIYQITLIFLAPFCIIGFLKFLQMPHKIFKKNLSDKIVRHSFKFLSIFFAIFLLFNSGFVNELLEDKPISISLNNSIDYPRFNTQEVLTGKWITMERNESYPVYADVFRGLLLLGQQGEYHYFINPNIKKMPPNVYIFLGDENIKNQKILVLPSNPGFKREILIDLVNWSWYNSFISINKIYDSGHGQIYNR